MGEKFMLLENKVAIITGASGGLGRAQALEYVKEGASVVINDVQEEGLKETQKMIEELDGKVLSVIADISKKEDVQRMVKEALDKFGRVDICVNNAAVLLDFKAIGEITEEEWDRVMNVNLKGVYLITHELLPHMIKQGKGTFINISSASTFLAGCGDAAYMASKHAINGMVKQLAYDYALDGIRAVGLAPGLTDTPMVNYAIEQRHPQAIRQVNNIPDGKIGTSEKVATVSAFLASDKADSINGEIVKVDRGKTIGVQAKWVEID